MLLAAEDEELNALESIERLSEYTPRIRTKLSEMALAYNINIIGGSHPTRMPDGDIHKWVEAGKAVRAAPPWPETAYLPNGDLPKYVTAQWRDGKLICFC